MKILDCFMYLEIICLLVVVINTEFRITLIFHDSCHIVFDLLLVYNHMTIHCFNSLYVCVFAAKFEVVFEAHKKNESESSEIRKSLSPPLEWRERCLVSVLTQAFRLSAHSATIRSTSSSTTSFI